MTVAKLQVLASASLLLGAGCQQYPELADHGQVCVSSVDTDGQLRLTVNANSGDCAADHEGASFECTITTDGLSARVETIFQDGKDPNDACAGPLETTCEVAVEPGTYTVEFADEQYELVVPSDEVICLPGGGSGTEG